MEEVDLSGISINFNQLIRKGSEKYMMLKFLYLAITVFFMLLLVGCSNNQDAGNATDKDEYGKVREVAWKFVEAKDWSATK